MSEDANTPSSVMIAAFEGWNDACQAASSITSVFSSGLTPPLPSSIQANTASGIELGVIQDMYEAGDITRVQSKQLIAFMPWNGYNYEDAVIISQRLVQDDTLSSSTRKAAPR